MKLLTMKGVLEVNGAEAGTFETKDGGATLVLVVPVPQALGSEMIVRGLEALLERNAGPRPALPAQPKPGELEAAIKQGAAELKTAKPAEKPAPAEKPKEEPPPPKSAPRAVEKPVPEKADPNDDIPFGKDEKPKPSEKVDKVIAKDGNEKWGFVAEPPIELTGAKKMATVIKYLWDQGLREEDEYIEACEKLVEHVPVLAQATNLRDRVLTSLSVRRDRAAEEAAG